MIYLELIINLALLVAISVVSGFIDQRWSRSTRIGALLQGALFGGAAVIGMLRPLDMGSGLIFDGRSVMISLCALFFGPWAASVAVLMTIPCRIALGGAGMIMGVLVILSSAGIGLAAHFRSSQAAQPPSTRHLYWFGLVVHLVMVALMLTLPGNIIMSTIKHIGIPVILLYPLATILAGKILSDQLSTIRLVETLRKSEEKFRSVFESANVGKSLTLPSGEINVNRAFCDMLGYTKEELKGKKWQDITPAENIEITQNEIDSLLQDKKDSARFNKKYIHKNGSHIWADVNVAILRDIDRKPLFFITTVIDITERKQLEEALRDSETRFKTLHNASFGGIAIHDKGVILDCNTGMSEITGYTFEELTNMDGLLLIAPQSRKTVMDNILAGYEKPYEVMGIRKNGEEYNLRLEARNIPYKEKIVRAVEFRDITENKKAEEEIRLLNEELEKKVAQRTGDLRDSQLALLNLVDDLSQGAKHTEIINRKLEETNKELASFSYSVSHDLRAPLRSIDGFSLALLEDYQEKLDDTGRNYINKIRAATQRMGSLIEDILKLSRITHVAFRHESVDLSKIVQSVADTLQQNNPDKNVQINIQKNIVIQGDRSSLEIVMTNLLENAWKFTGKQNNPCIEFGMNLSEGKKILFVRDNGVGFDMAYANKLFGAFQRLHRQDEFPGTGIGLATVKRIITRHGGQIWVESEVGKGAVFYFTLP